MRQPAPRPHRLPESLSTFVGRDREQAWLIERLGDSACRLLTIVGPGGVGKTRLALETARSLVASADHPVARPHGVCFVSLASLSAGEAVDEALATTIAEALPLGLAGPTPPTTQLRAYLGEKALVLVLDNVEHVLAVAPFLATLLHAAPGLTIVATSRERLNLRGEWVLTLDGLTVPPAASGEPRGLAHYSAMQLFEQAARRLAPDFALTVETRPAVSRICQLVDGLPLGIELAASWIRILSCAEIASEIAQNLDFLAAGAQDLPARQQGLRAVFASSWELLAPEEQRALRRLGIFRGSFTRKAATTVGGATLPQLASLVDKSLVRRLALDDVDATVRYRLPEPLRPYAAEQLTAAGDWAATATCHAQYYLDWLGLRTPDLRGPDQRRALAAIGAEIAEIRVAWRWAVDNVAADRIGAAASSLFHFYDMQSWFGEGAEVFATASEALAPLRPADATDTDRLGPIWSRCRASQGWFTFQLGHHVEARTLLEESLIPLRARQASADLVFPLNYLAAVCAYLGDYAGARALGLESRALAETTGDAYGKAVAGNILGQTAYEQGRDEEARTWHEQSLAIEQQLGNRWSMAFSLSNLGRVVARMGAHAEARRLFERSLLIREEMGDTRGVATCHARLGDVAVALRQVTEAGSAYGQSYALFREIGNEWGMTAALISLGQLAAAHRQDAAATRLFQEALRLALQTWSPPQMATLLRAFAHLIRRRGDPAWAAEVERLAATPTRDMLTGPAARLLAETWSADAAAMTLEQAIAAAQAPGQRPADAGVGSPAPPTGASAYPAGLTTREVDVMRLVAQGLTDAQVAAALSVSPRTVSTHLTSIYGKLGVSSRSAATRFAVEHGLT